MRHAEAGPVRAGDGAGDAEQAAARRGDQVRRSAELGGAKIRACRLSERHPGTKEPKASSGWGRYRKRQPAAAAYVRVTAQA